MTSLIGLTPGYLTGAATYRNELRLQRHNFVRLAPAAIIGGLTGGLLLRTTPSDVFERIVPYLVIFSTLLLYVQPYLTKSCGKAQTSAGASSLKSLLSWQACTAYISRLVSAFFCWRYSDCPLLQICSC